MKFPEIVAVYPEGPPPKSVDTTPKTRFTWDPTTKCLGMEPKTTPEDLAKLMATGVCDGMVGISIGEYDKNMTGLPPLPEGVQASLQEVHIWSSKFTDWSGLYALDRVKSLFIHEKVSVIPEGISGMTSLETLVIKGRRLKELPPDLATLSSLKSLKIVSAPITALPDTLGQLPLETLELDWTKKLKTLPDSLGQCQTLRTLSTDCVPLKALPEGIYTHKSLETLSILNAKISKLGSAIDWPALRHLDLQSNYKKWPAKVSIPQLEEAVLGQKFGQLPDLFVPSLKRIWVHAPLTSVDPRLAGLTNQRKSNQRGAPMMGVKMTCTKAAYEALSEAEREAFGSRLTPEWD